MHACVCACVSGTVNVWIVHKYEHSTDLIVDHCMYVCVCFAYILSLFACFVALFISIRSLARSHTHTRARIQTTAADFVYAEQTNTITLHAIYISKAGRNDSRLSEYVRMLSILPVSVVVAVRTKNASTLVLFYCAGILTFACPLLLFILFANMFFFHFSFTSAHWYSTRTVCSLRLIPSHYLILILRFAQLTFELVCCIVYTLHSMPPSIFRIIYKHFVLWLYLRPHPHIQYSKQ